MKDGVAVRTLEELRNNFDLDKVIGYFLDGKLFTWLEARYYDNELTALQGLDKNDPDFNKNVCDIFGVAYNDTDNGVDIESFEDRNNRITKLKQYTSDPYILSKVDSVAFDQEDLAYLLDEELHDIYLCSNTFSIPLRVENKRYIGIGNVEVVIRSKERIDFAEKSIEFENIRFDDAYAKINQDTPERIYALGQEAENQGDYENAFKYYVQLANKKHLESMFKVGWLYDTGNGVSQNYEKANEWYDKAAECGHTIAMNNIGANYENGHGVPQNIEKAKEWYQKAADLGYSFSMKNLGNIYYNSNNYSEAFRYFEQAANLGQPYANYMLGWQYEFGQGVSADSRLAQEHYKKSAKLGYYNDDLQYDPAFRYGYISIFIYRDIASARLWFSELCKTSDQKKRVVDYVIQHFRQKPISKRWTNYFISSYTSQSLFFGDYSKNEIYSLAQNTFNSYVEKVIKDVNLKQKQYGDEATKEYYYYILAAIVCGDEQITFDDADNFGNYVNQQVNEISSISVYPPIEQAINSIRIEENYNGGGAFAKKTYRLDNEQEVRDIVQNYMQSTLAPMEKRTYEWVSTALMDLAAKLEAYKRTI